MSTRAVFLDRDGTIIEDTGYVDDPDKVKLLPRAGEAIARLNRAGYLVVIISNQSGVARGIFDEDMLSSVHQRMEALLAPLGATIDGAYYCPYLDGPEATVPGYRRDSALRKPKPGMLLQAAEEMNIDLKASWMVGNSKRDVQAGKRADCRTIRLGDEPDTEATHTVADLSQAVSIIEGRPVERATAREPAVEHAGVSSSRTTVRGGGRGGLTASPTSGRAVTAPATTSAVAPSPGQSAPSREKAIEGANPRNPDRDVLHALERIYDELERANRPKRQHDFSVVRLFGALLQMLAVVACVLGVMKMANDEDAAGTARFALGCLLQLGSLTAFAVDRFR